MRINPVAYSPVVTYQRKTSDIQNAKKHYQQEPSFRGCGGFLGTLVGAGAGVVLTAMTGGALAWTIPVLSGCAGIGGDMYEKKDKPQTDQYGR